jgi:hypothetical protein
VSTKQGSLFAFIGGALLALLAGGAYLFYKNVSSPHANVRVEDGVCMKQLRVGNLVSTDGAKVEGTDLPPPRLCGAPEFIRIRPRLIHMMGDVYEIKCESPGFPASARPLTVFYWDKGKSYGEQISVRSYSSTDGPLDTAQQCAKYGVRSLQN